MLMMAVVFSFSMAAYALDGDQQVEFSNALSDGNVKVVQKYLDSGVDVNDKYFAWSALQIAANKNQLAVVKLLVDKGADVNYKHPILKMTSLQLAAYDGFEDVVKYLISKGADVNVKMRGNVSIVRALKDKGDTKMVDVLVAAGAKDDGCQEEQCF